MTQRCEALLEMRANGRTNVEIAAVIGISRQRVAQLIGNQTSRKQTVGGRRPWSEPETQTLFDLLRKANTYQQAADRLARTRGSIAGLCHRVYADR